MPKAIELVVMILSALGLSDLANKISSAVADGKITAQEGLAISESLAKQLESVIPGEKAELELAYDLASAVDKYLKAKGTQAPPASAPPSSAPPSSGGAPGGPGGKPLPKA